MFAEGKYGSDNKTLEKTTLYHSRMSNTKKISFANSKIEETVNDKKENLIASEN